MMIEIPGDLFFGCGLDKVVEVKIFRKTKMCGAKFLSVS